MYKFYPSKSGRKYLKEERKKELKKTKRNRKIWQGEFIYK